MPHQQPDPDSRNVRLSFRPLNGLQRPGAASHASRNPRAVHWSMQQRPSTSTTSS